MLGAQVLSVVNRWSERSQHAKLTALPGDEPDLTAAEEEEASLAEEFAKSPLPDQERKVRGRCLVLQ